MGSRVAVAVVLGLLATSAPAAAATYAKGVDVSHWQGAIQWPRVAGANVTFAFVKATEGKTLIDLTYPVNRSGANTVGLRVGAYHFARPGGSGEAGLTANAIAQADFFLDVAEPQPGDLPPVLDLEVKGGLGTAALQTWTAAWLQEIAARTGVSALVYASPNFWKTALGNTTSIAANGNPLWIAHWTNAAAPLVPAANWNGQGWSFWQYSSHATVPGFLHEVDADRFRGVDPSLAALPAYAEGLPAVSAPPTIIGAAQTGKTLAGVPGTWSGGKPVTFTYQWQRCDAAGAGCVPIAGATTETYVPVTDDVGHALTLAVTAQTDTGAAVGTSPPTVAVSAAGGVVTRPAATSAPTVAGTAQAGQALTASVGTWSGSPTSFVYQWRRCKPDGTQCVAIVGATASTYTLTPDDIGATVSLLVTATGSGGSTSAQAALTAPVVPAPVPAPVVGSLVAQPGAAGAVSTADASATVTWQPGAVPIGSTLTLAPAGKGLAVGISPAVEQLPWPVDLAYAAPTSGVIGVSSDGKVWHAVPQQLGVSDLAASYVDQTTGLTHVLLRAPLRVAIFQPGLWGDPSLVADGPPAPKLVGPVKARRLKNGSVLVTARVRLPSQAHLWISVNGPTRQSLLRRPGAVPVRVRLSGKHVVRGAKLTLRVAARDPWGRRATLLTRFRAP